MGEFQKTWSFGRFVEGMKSDAAGVTILCARCEQGLRGCVAGGFRQLPRSVCRIGGGSEAGQGQCWPGAGDFPQSAARKIGRAGRLTVIVRQDGRYIAWFNSAINDRCAATPAIAPSATAKATLPATRAISPQQNTPGTFVAFCASVCTKSPIGPASIPHPSWPARALELLVRDMTNSPAMDKRRPSFNTTSAAPSIRATGVASIVTLRRASAARCASFGVNAPFRKNVTRPQSGSRRAWCIDISLVASTPISPSSRS